LIHRQFGCWRDSCFFFVMIEILLWIGGWLLIICGVAWAIGMATGTRGTSDD